MAQHKSVIYGDPGVGKTTFLLSYPQIFVIDTDNGLEGDAIKGRDLIHYEDLVTQDLQPTDIVFCKPRGHKELETAVKWFIANRKHFKTVGVDSIDGLSRMLLNEVVDEGKGKAKSLMQIFVPEQAEYGVNLRQMERVFDNLAALGVHVVCTAGVRDKEGTKRTADVIPSVQSVVRRWTNLMGEIVVVRRDAEGNIAPKGAPERVLMLDSSSPKRECKTRWSVLHPYVERVTFTRINELIEGDQ